MSVGGRSGLTPLETALKVILSNLAEIDSGTELLALDNCIGRILAQDVVSAIQVPPTANSAVDGYIVTKELCGLTTRKTKPIVARIPAGICPPPLPASAVARIFTGATIPESGVAVVMQEDCQPDGQAVILPASIQYNQNIRAAGQDIAAHTKILEKGILLKPQDIGLAASVGLDRLPVKAKLKVAIFSTGDELVNPGSIAPVGKIYNSNRYTLTALLTKLVIDVVDLGIIPDDFRATVEVLNRASEADLVISSGGVSVGEEDHIKAALQHMGQLSLWKLAIKPGKPLAFGLLGKTPFLGLPGNPSSVFVTFCFVAIKVIETLRGQLVPKHHQIKLPAFFDITKAGLRQEYLRVRLCERGGVVGLEKHPNQSSGVLSSASWADGFAVIPVGRTLNSGDSVEYISFSSLGI